MQAEKKKRKADEEYCSILIEAKGEDEIERYVCMCMRLLKREKERYC